MRTIFLDSEFKCHVTDGGNMTAVETDFFDGYCDTYIEGYRFIPDGESWTRSDGQVFHGRTPWKSWDKLEAAQNQYEAMLDDMDNAYREGVASA